MIKRQNEENILTELSTEEESAIVGGGYHGYYDHHKYYGHYEYHEHHGHHYYPYY